MRKRRDCLSLWRIWRKASPAASSLSSSMSSSSTPSSRSEQVWEKSNQFITGWRQNQISKKSNQSPLGDVAHIQIPAPPSLRNWYRRRMRHEERLKVLNFSPNVVLLHICIKQLLSEGLVWPRTVLKMFPRMASQTLALQQCREPTTFSKARTSKSLQISTSSSDTALVPFRWEILNGKAKKLVGR